MPNRRWITQLVTANLARRKKMPISILSLPGTHDSCTANLSTLVEWTIQRTAKCQDRSLRDQFNNGIRYFDIRVRVEGQHLYIVHDGPVGVMDCYCYYDDPQNGRRIMELDDVIEAFIDRLDIRNPANKHYDFVIMSIKVANSSIGYENVLADYLRQKQINNYCFCPTNTPVITVEAAAKKIVLLNRVSAIRNDIAGFSIDASEWGKNGNTGLVTTDIMKLNVMVQDEYNITNVQTKIDTYNKMNRNAKDGFAGILILNHLSCTNVYNVVHPTTIFNVKEMADQVNQEFINTYANNIKDIRGVTVMDFPGNNQINMIIQSNNGSQFVCFGQYTLYIRN